MNEIQGQFIAHLIPYIVVCFVLLISGLGRNYFGESEINEIIGYRTTRSMRSREAWKEAHLYWGKVCLIVSSILIASGYWVFKLRFPIALLIALSGLFITVILTEIHLARKFPKQ